MNPSLLYLARDKMLKKTGSLALVDHPDWEKERSEFNLPPPRQHIMSQLGKVSLITFERHWDPVTLGPAVDWGKG